MAEIGFFIVILLGFPGPSDGLRLHPIVFFSSGSGLTADSSVLTLTLAFLDFGLDFAQSFPFHAQFCHFGLLVFRGNTFRDVVESTTRTPTSVSSSSIKDKGKAKIDEPEVPLKKKDQIALDEEMDRNLEAQIQAELIEEEMLARKKEEEANIALIESWDNTQAMIEANFELAQRLQAEEQGEITIEERSRLFVELMNKRKKHFAKLRA
ncbi:ribonuclease H-like domain-containing protein [Tanacetum coccineum]